MMISPECYVEFEIKGKGKDEICRKIRDLKRELAAMKNKAENNIDFVDVVVSPSLDTRISVTRDYIEAAIDYLNNRGYEYPLTNAEKNARVFEENIPYIESIYVEYCEYRGAHHERKISHVDDKIKVLEDFEFMLPVLKRSKKLYKGMSWSGLLEDLKTVHMGEWKSRYKWKDIVFADGSCWKIVIEYNNGTSPKRFSGDNKFPFSYKRFMEIMEIKV